MTLRLLWERLKSCPGASCNPECIFTQPVKARALSKLRTVGVCGIPPLTQNKDAPRMGHPAWWVVTGHMQQHPLRSLMDLRRSNGSILFLADRRHCARCKTASGENFFGKLSCDRSGGVYRPLDCRGLAGARGKRTRHRQLHHRQALQPGWAGGDGVHRGRPGRSGSLREGLRRGRDRLPRGGAGLGAALGGRSGGHQPELRGRHLEFAGGRPRRRGAAGDLRRVVVGLRRHADPAQARGDAAQPHLPLRRGQAGRRAST